MNCLLFLFRLFCSSWKGMNSWWPFKSLLTVDETRWKCPAPTVFTHTQGKEEGHDLSFPLQPSQHLVQSPRPSLLHNYLQFWHVEVKPKVFSLYLNMFFYLKPVPRTELFQRDLSIVDVTIYGRGSNSTPKTKEKWQKLGTSLAIFVKTSKASSFRQHNGCC